MRIVYKIGTLEVHSALCVGHAAIPQSRMDARTRWGEPKLPGEVRVPLRGTAATLLRWRGRCVGQSCF